MPEELLARFVLTVPADLADAAIAELGDLSPEGFEERAAGEPGSVPGAVTFVLHARPAGALALRDGLQSLVATLGCSTVVEDEVPDQNWREVWKDRFEVQHIDRFVIRPSWIPYTAGPAEHVIHLDPGSAFGTGLHESTRLCLRALLAEADAGRRPARALDFGCGTGILGLAARLLWPGLPVLAVDDDPLALSACTENLARNGGAEGFTLADALDPAAAGYALVLANVSRPVLLMHLEPLLQATAPGGRLVLSGLLVDDGPVVEAAYADRGARRVAGLTEHDWVALVMERPRL